MTSILDAVIPFRYLATDERAALARELAPQLLRRGELVYRQGDARDDRVFLLESGTVETLDIRRGPGAPVSTITAGHYFGERAALFAEPRRHDARVLDDARVWSLGGERFLRLIRESRTFALALGDILRDKQGLFEAFDRFLAEIGHAVSLGDLPFRRTVAMYRALEPALHPLAGDPERIDFGALAYATRRLPANVGRTLTWFLTDNLPHLYSDPDATFRAMPSDVRPRAVYELLPGKNMVLLRDGLSDLIDLVSCLCLWAVEARKLRRRLGRPSSLVALAGWRGGDAAAARAHLAGVGFTNDEAARLVEVFPDEPVRRLAEIALHHEDFAIQIRKQRNNYNSRHSESWSTQVAEATKLLVGHDPADLPADVRVHVISSNTHSVGNCLSPTMPEAAPRIAAWGRATGHPLAAETWHEEHDLAYALARDYFAAHPEEAEARRKRGDATGRVRLTQTAFTGIQVELYDLAQVATHAIDPGLPRPRAGRHDLLVNIDFAFGQQAEEILGNLLILFGRNLASVNVLGKAGALVGNRGDVLIPTGFVEQTTDALVTLPPSPGIDAARLRGRLPGRQVHEGRMLTVSGTLLQNRTMLQFYRNLWQCVGLEMEGYFYHRRLAESALVGTLAPDVAWRFLYYVSDTPLGDTGSLSARLAASEGIPPLYAVTREILGAILDA